MADRALVGRLPVSGVGVAPSGGKPFAALGPPRIDHGAASAGRHAGAKAMTARTLQAAWLESTLHSCNLGLARKKNRLE